MKTRAGLLVPLLIALTATILAQGPGNKKPRTPQDYQPRTLKELSTLVPETFAADPQYRNGYRELAIIVHGDLLPSRVKVQYEGKKRPLDERKKALVKQWADRFAGMPEFYTVPYQTEALFSEAGEEYWLAVRTESLPALAQELKTGDTVELFVIKLGNVRINRTDEKMEPVWLVEKFAKQ